MLSVLLALAPRVALPATERCPLYAWGLAMVIGSGSLLLTLLLLTLCSVAFKWPRVFGPIFGGMGCLLGLYLVASVALDWSFPYQTWDISIYIVFFLAVIFTVSGLVAAIAWFQRRSTGP
jgi:hypothetical protein